MAVKSIRQQADSRLSATRSIGRQSDLMSEVMRVCSASLSDTAFVFAAIVCGFVVLTHMDDLESGPLGHFFVNHRDNKIVSFIMKDVDKFFGVLMFVPLSLRVPKSLRSFVFASASVAVIICPPLHIWSYLITSVGLLFFINFRNPTFKAVVVVALAFYLSAELKPLLSRNSNRTPAPNIQFD